MSAAGARDTGAGTPETEDALEEALELLEDTAPEYPPFGFVNHGPMVAEALTRLGRADAVVPWTLDYRGKLDAAPEPGTAVDTDDWAGSLGDLSRFADWEARFALELESEPWADVVGRWVPRLVRGVSADALHGVIRVGHAVRGLEARVTDLRTRELARGLALWAATYLPLPGDPAAAGGGPALPPLDAVRSIRRITDEERGDVFSIVAGLIALHDVADFAPVIGLVDPAPDPAAFLVDLGSTFAQVALEQVRDPLSAIVFTHTITGPAALGLLLPYLPAETHASAAAFAWQAAAGVYAALGSEPAAASTGEHVPDVEDLVERAIATADEHAIKLTEACVRLDDGSGMHLAAADIAVAALAESA